jgi:ADP-heptose:LPS heptosyltransferase
MRKLRQELQEIHGETDARIVVMRTGALGDTILLLPTLQLLAGALPGVKMTLIGSSWARRLQPMSGVTYDFVAFDSAELTPLFTECPGELPQPLRSVAAAVLYTSDPAGPLVRTLGSAVDRFIGWPVEPAPDRHAAVHFAAAVTSDLPSVNHIPTPSLQPTPQARRAAEQWLRANRPTNGPVILVHPGSGSPHKCWPITRFAALVGQLTDRGQRVVVLEGPADEKSCRRLTTGIPELPVFRESNLMETAGLLSSVSICVTNDSGIGHLAAALGTATVSIFGPTNPAVWRPLGTLTRVVGNAEGALAAARWPAVQRVQEAIESLLSDLREIS